MTKIYAKNKSFNGVSASVHFVDGVGETDDQYLIEWFKNHDYKVDEEQKPILDEEETEDEEPKAKRRRN